MGSIRVCKARDLAQREKIAANIHTHARARARARESHVYVIRSIRRHCLRKTPEWKNPKSPVCKSGIELAGSSLQLHSKVNHSDVTTLSVCTPCF